MENEEFIKKHFTKIDENWSITTTRDKENVYAITTLPRNTNIKKKQDNYVLEDKKMIRLRESTKKGYKECDVGDGVELSRSSCSIRRGVSQEKCTGALNTQEGSWGTVTNDYRIRKLTPKECERLQAFPDGWTEYGVDGEKISDTQRYKCIGNAVTTTVVTAIVNEMFKDVDL